MLSQECGVAMEYCKRLRNVAGEERPAGGPIARAGQRWAVSGELLF